MSYSLDLNILLYAADEDSPFHIKAKRFLQSQLQTDEACYLAWETLYGFMRISTHPGIFRNPLTPKQALANIQALLDQPQVTTLSADTDSWTVFRELAGAMPIRGALVPDALLATVLIANGIKRLYSRDRDFWKFPHLKPVDPIL